MRKTLLKFIDLFYPILSKWVSLNTFRYLATGGITAGTSIIGYFLIYNYVLGQDDIRFNQYLITAHTLALIINSVLTFLVGFVMNKYLVFTQSTLKGRIQLFRYGTVFATNILLNFAMLKILVEGLHFYPSIANAIITIILGLFSYFSQKYFSFRIKRPLP
ncbi:MAG: GtrA family protein [Chitinophagaceae bacterium]|nr:MAG: GtrA family protein [Chitinophagaceae bacterium]